MGTCANADALRLLPFTGNRAPLRARMDGPPHFTRMRTTLTGGDVLERSLRDLGDQVERQVSVRGYRGQRTPVELRVPTKSSGYDIGFRRNGGTAYEMVADWWGSRRQPPGRVVTDPSASAIGRPRPCPRLAL